MIGLLCPIVIYLYYLYIESWLLGYSLFAATGRYDQCTTSAGMLSFLHGSQGLEKNRFFAGLETAYLFYLLTFGLNGLVLYFGVRRGIERVCRYGLPLLFALAMVLLVRVFLLDTPDPTRPENNVLNGLGYLWNPDWAALLRPRVWLATTGQIFFTLSCGQGIILTYASYLGRADDVALSSLTAASANEFAEVVLWATVWWCRPPSPSLGPPPSPPSPPRSRWPSPPSPFSKTNSASRGSGRCWRSWLRPSCSSSRSSSFWAGG